MERLKEVKEYLNDEEYNHLHSSMERLKAYVQRTYDIDELYLHSSMERLKAVKPLLILIMSLIFTFQYGEIKSNYLCVYIQD